MQRTSKIILNVINAAFLFCFFPLISASELYDPVSVYLTWQRNPESSITIQWITSKNREDDLIEFQTLDEDKWHQAEGIHFPMPDHHPFFIHRLELTNLQPNTDYRFRTGHDGVIFKFRTMPTDIKQPLRFIVGGDMYHDSLDILMATNQQAAKMDPSFVVVGGDIAYSGRKFWFMEENAQRWLDWLIAWKKQMVTSDGRLIPMIPVIGNHETNGRFGQTPAQAPFFYSLFPMPGIQGYNVLDFNDYLSLFLLDSGHTHPIEGDQAQWLFQAMQERQQMTHKFAAYHVPAYPSFYKFGNIGSKISLAIRKQWIPTFERFGLHAAFEHHCHTYKRTVPIYKGKANPRGVLYIGDGAWGVESPRIPKTSKQAWYLAKTASKRHFILVTLKENHRLFEAITPEGQKIDEYMQ